LPIDSSGIRFLTLDLARGLALIGVALVNVHAIAMGWDGHYALDLAESRIDIIAEYIVGLFFAHRAYPTLAFLFGVGIVLQWQRMDVDQRSVAPLRARMVALLMLGIVHGLLLWPGEVTSSYAIMGLVVLIGWPRSDGRALTWLGIVMCLSVGPLFSVALAWALIDYESPLAAFPVSSFAYPDIDDALLRHGYEFMNYGLAQLQVAEMWAAVLFGVWVAQSGRLHAWLRREKTANVWFAMGVALYVLGALLDVLAARNGGWNQLPGNSRGVALQMAALLPGMVGSVFVTFGIARAWADRPRSIPREFIEAAGKTPLTQFFGQSLVFAFVFNESIGGWHDEMDRAAYSCVALLTFFLWAGFARAWLASGHSRGPIEIVWMKLASALNLRPVQ
jgi:uncharacterized protein